MNKAVIYARVSTEEQAEKGYSLQTQIEACEEYSRCHNLQVVRVLKENYTGATLERPEFIKVREMVKNGEVNTVVVYQLDRLSRDLVDLLVICREWLRGNINLYTLDIGQVESEFDIVLVIKGWQGSDERQKIKERTTRGRIAKARTGKWVGTGDPPFGYRREGTKGDTRLVIDDFQASIVQRIFEEYVGKNGTRPKNLQQIARELTQENIQSPGRGKGWYRTSLYRILRSRIYIGEYVYAGVTVPLPDVKLIEFELWEAAQNQRVKNKVFSKRNRKLDYLLSGFLRCSCGLKMYSQSMQGGRYLYYHCGGRSYKKHLLKCNSKYVRADLADALAWRWIKNLLLDDEQLEVGLKMYAERRKDEIKPMRERLATIEGLIISNERKLKNLTDELSEFNGTAREAIRDKLRETSELLDRLIAERNHLLVEIDNWGFTETDENSIKEQALEVRNRLSLDPAFEQKRSLLKSLDFKAQLREDSTGRWLDVSCGIKAEPANLPLDGQVSSIVYHSY